MGSIDNAVILRVKEETVRKEVKVLLHKSRPLAKMVEDKCKKSRKQGN